MAGQVDQLPVEPMCVCVMRKTLAKLTQSMDSRGRHDQSLIAQMNDCLNDSVTPVLRPSQADMRCVA